MKKLLSVFLLCSLLVCLTGCDEKKENNVETGNEVSFECDLNSEDYAEDYGDKLTVTMKTTGRFNKDGYLVYAKYKTVEVAADEETYADRKDANDPELMESDDEVVFDDANRTITITGELESNPDELDADEKEASTIKTFISDLESVGYVCKLTGKTRAEVGLE